MKLSEFLENANCKFIKIGTCGGSFLYCGSLKNLDTKKVDRSYRKFIRERRKVHLENVKRYQSKGIMIKEEVNEKKVDKISRYGRYMTVDEFVKLRIDEERKRYESYERKRKDYKPIAKREIKDIYNSVLHDDCIIVILEGTEHGDVYDMGVINNVRQRNL